MTRRRPRRPSGTALVLLASLLAGSLLAGTAHADPASDLNSARAQAQALRDRLDLLDAKQEQAGERLAYAQSRLAEAAQRSTSMEERVSALASLSDQASQLAAERVRDLYRMGGAVGVYGSVLSADSPADLATRMAAVQSVLGFDQQQVLSTDQRVQAAATTQDTLAALTSQRVRLVARVDALSGHLQALRRATADLLAQADARVTRLAAALAKQRAAQQAQQAAQTLQQLGVAGSTEPAGNPYGDAAVSAALSVLGSPYVFGTEGPDTFDCSGLVQWAYAKAGLVLPRLADEQYFASKPIPLSDLRPGDLLVYAYNTSDPSTIHHIAMYIGGGQMVHAPHTGDVVRIAPVYLDGLYGAARPGV